MKKILFGAALAAATALAGPAFAEGGSSANLTVTLIIKHGCSVSFADGGAISFGVLPNLASAKDQTGNLVVNCGVDNPNARLAKVALDSAISGSRIGDGNFRMLGSNDDKQTINYYVFKGTAGTNLWGLDGDYRYSAPAANAKGDMVMPFRVSLQNGQQDKPDDTYTDRLVATLIYN